MTPFVPDYSAGHGGVTHSAGHTSHSSLGNSNPSSNSGPPPVPTRKWHLSIGPGCELIFGLLYEPVHASRRHFSLLFALEGLLLQQNSAAIGSGSASTGQYLF